MCMCAMISFANTCFSLCNNIQTKRVDQIISLLGFVFCSVDILFLLYAFVAKLAKLAKLVVCLDSWNWR
ncbi:hypothetical protein BDZ91DRAFT_246798 [Kalaharituber pfeilii]|nr:hypothetical protein BDZ91DRAFT_246798 [Kalaharituber pfeilii]